MVKASEPLENRVKSTIRKPDPLNTRSEKTKEKSKKKKKSLRYTKPLHHSLHVLTCITFCCYLSIPCNTCNRWADKSH